MSSIQPGHAVLARPPQDEGRSDPIARLQRQEQTRLAWLLPIRHARMASSPFAFFRGSPAVMADDLGGAIHSGLEVQLCGDAHLLNFGFYASPERALLFDLNDFDETARGPFEWDVKRLVSSLVVAAAELNLDGGWPERLARRCPRAYSQAMGKLCRVDCSGRLQIRHDPPLIWQHAQMESEPEALPLAQRVQDTYASYLSSIRPEVQRLLVGFELVDTASKAVGVGSVGTRCSIGLLVGSRPDDVLVLQSKQAEASVFSAYATSPSPQHQGQRVVEGQRLMQTVSDGFLGWTTNAHGEHLYWRHFRDWKGAVVLSELDGEGVLTYGKLCAKALAKAHARSGDRQAIAAYLGEGPSFEEAMAAYGLAYGTLSQRDFAQFRRALRDGDFEPNGRIWNRSPR